MLGLIWNDNRSGNLGRIAGSLVLNKIMKLGKSSKIFHEKGTIFSSEEQVFIGRVCATDSYLQSHIAHFSNLSKDQNKQVAIDYPDKKLSYVFITVGKNCLNFWLVPAAVIEEELKYLPVKPDHKSCFLRIVERNRKYFIGSQDITKYFYSMIIDEDCYKNFCLTA